MEDMNEPSLSYYLERYAAGLITPQEKLELQRLIQDPENAGALRRIMDEEWPRMEQSDLEFPAGIARLQTAVAEMIRQESTGSSAIPPTHRIHFLRRNWLRYAAALIVLLGFATLAYVVFSDRQPAGRGTDVTKKGTQSDIQPGYNRAVLTLSNGQQVALDSAASEVINDGSLAIRNSNGELMYGKSEVVVMNTMTTPNGGQYQLTLADGTKVWLNAASSITYPTAFSGVNRQVIITGEAYMEVAEDAAHPFLVDIAGRSTVEVLGTRFNINAYDNEGKISTTLVSGSVKISNNTDPTVTARSADQQLNSTGLKSVILKPGQQAIQLTGNSGAITVHSTVAIDHTLAWKNGMFSFNNADLQSAMRQLERWYDIRVRYEGKIPAITLNGKMFRDVLLSDVLEFLEESGLKFRMEDRTLVVL